ncbi:LexA repressor [Limihaloglobus sulfuriphilus]|uniref:LexA repressor n=1 Tax=Limihaloglobus sulfuriphilus TaxID=1851148 RepID=A0A1Q2MCF2_9BACT|nr:XRE family transcriptional regulator [Limihaloglobus sulfuriphilus]AQQ69967.1 LexA repressor [Limihaloglobus sulfuriphilus]
MEINLGIKIRRKRIKAGMSLGELGRRAGCSKPYLSTIENGKVKNPPSADLLKKLEAILRFNDGELIEAAAMCRLPNDIRLSFERDRQESALLKHLIAGVLNNTINTDAISGVLQKNNVSVDKSVNEYRDARLIPVINRVPAGKPAGFDDMGYPVGVAEDYIKCPGLNDPNAFCFRVWGDSMEPRFCENDLVIVSPARDVHNGDDCFIRLNNPHETTFKRVFFESDNIIRLQPRNETYAPIVVEAQRVTGIYKAVVKYQLL